MNEYIYSSGVLTKENIDQKLVQLPQNSSKKYKKKKLIGRIYITFKRSIVEFQAKEILKRGGPVPFDRLGGQKDIVSKNLLIYNLLIGNMDNKIKNNKNLLVYNPFNESYDYYEYQHDNGSSFGRIFHPRDINAFKVGHQFLKVKRNKIIFKQFRYFKPKIWKKLTTGDLNLFGQKLKELSDNDIKQAVASIPWPAFMLEVISYKLKQRRNDILFALEIDKSHRFETPTNISIDLTKIKKVHNDYKIPTNEIKKALRNGHTIDVLVKNGKINSCHQSMIINFLEQYKFASGLTRSLKTKKDNRPLPKCSFIY